MVEKGLLTPAEQSQYSTTVFIIPKKDGTVRFITDHRRINQPLVRNPFPSPIIVNIIQQLDGLKYATAFDLNMFYYNITLYSASQDMTKIVTEFGKFIYHRFCMGMCASVDIFQDKVDELLDEIESVKTYTNYMLVLSKYWFRNDT